MLPSSTIDLLFLIMAIMATRSFSHQPLPIGASEPPTPRSSSSLIDRASSQAPYSPNTPTSAVFTMKQAEGRGPSDFTFPSSRALSSPSQQVRPALRQHIQPIPKITFTPDTSTGTGTDTATDDQQPDINSRLAALTSSLSLARPKHGRKSVSFSLSSMDEIIKTPRYKTIAKRPPTPFIRGPASPSQKGQVGELVLGMSVGIGLGAGLGEEVGLGGHTTEGKGGPEAAGSGCDGTGLKEREKDRHGYDSDSSPGMLTPRPDLRKLVLGPAVGGLEHSTERIDPMGVKKEWLMPK